MAEIFISDFVEQIADKTESLTSFFQTNQRVFWFERVVLVYVRHLGFPIIQAELRKIERPIFTIKAALVDAEQKQGMNDPVKDWLRKVKEAVYDLDDLLEDLLIEALRRQRVMSSAVQVCCYSVSPNSLKYSIILGHKLMLARLRLEDIASYGHALHLSDEVTETAVVVSKGTEETSSFVSEKEVIGRQDDRMAIVDTLLSSYTTSDNVCVIPIVGMGGLGKTTLAQLVYNDTRIKEYFNLRMWVHVSDVFDLRVIVEKALISITYSKPEGLVLDQLQHLLREKIGGKKYLLVLDDVWNEDISKWLMFKRIIECGERGSGVIVTTRSHTVAKITGTSTPYILQGLSSDDSWSLFNKLAFRRQELENQDAVAIGEEVVKNCGGVPLAIRTVGCLFYAKAENELLSMSKFEFWRLHQNEIMSSLKLSFDRLPPHLKRCFAYCSLFPKHYAVSVETLIQHWIAQGFIRRPSNSGQCLEDIGLKYFEELSSRCFFQDVEFDRLGNAVHYKIHDLMHDLATYVTGTETCISYLNVEHIDKNTRHVSLNLDFDVKYTWQVPKPLFAASKLRTMLSVREPHSSKFNQSRFETEERQLDAIFSRFTSLMVLDLQAFNIGGVPTSISKLKHLRYLNLSYNDRIRRLPDSIINLLNLQVLNLSYCDKLKELPKDIKYLVNLRHLQFEGCWNLTHMPCGLGKLTSLQTLTWFIVSESVSKDAGGLNELNKLNNLRGRLEIKNLAYVKGGISEFVGANLNDKLCLQSLSLYWDRDDDECTANPDYEEKSLQSLRPHPNLKELYVHDYAGVKFPSKFSFLDSLTTLWIQDCKRCKYLPQLNEIPALTSLVIKGLTELEYIDSEGATYPSGIRGLTLFPSLKTLWLSKCPNLTGWWKRRDDHDDATVLKLPHFPSLSSLHIQDCPLMSQMPLFPYLNELLWLENASIKPLQQTLEIEGMHGKSTSNFSPLSELKKLCIEKIEKLEEIPAEWQKFMSLEEVVICDCPNLASLFPRINVVTTLKVLEIRRCPLLYENFERDSDKDWPIPNIIIDNQKIQRQGHSQFEDRESSVAVAEIHKIL